jgi:hypothetical protein
MSISIRLDATTEAALRKRQSEQGVPLSAFVRGAIQEKLEHAEEAQSHYELGRALFGCYASGEPDLSTRRKEIIRAKLGAKHRRR